MKRLLVAVALLCASGLTAFASTSAITATVSDTDGTAWANATYSATLKIPGQPGLVPTISGVAVSPLTVSGTASTAGVITGTFTDTSSIDQSGARWIFTINPNASVSPVTVSVAIIGATPNLTANFSSVPAPRFPANPSAYGYADAEVTNPALGSTYFNTGTACGAAAVRQYSNSGWQCGAKSAILSGGALADYSFLDGSGTIVKDATGNGNNGTFLSGSNAPVWVKNGLSFDVAQGVQLPASLNNAQTFFFAVYRQPFTSGPQEANTYPVLLASNLDSAAANVILNTFGSNPDNLQDAATYTVFGPSSGGTVCGIPDPGFHVVAVELDNTKATNDRIFVDGVECSYKAQTKTGGLQTSGNLYLGSDAAGAWATSGLIGSMYRFVAYSGLLSSSDVVLNSELIRNEVASRGVATSLKKVVHSTPTINFIGDSITEGITGTTNPYVNQLSLTNTPPLTKTNWGIGSTGIIATASQEPQRVALHCSTIAGPAIATVFLGTNDATTSQSSVAYSVVDALISEISTLKQAGCKVYVFTMMSRNGYDTFKNTYDAQIVALATVAGADGIIDVAADARLGADGASTNVTYFNTDKVHPTDAGHVIIANIMNSSLNYYLSQYSSSNPHVIAASTTLASSDAAVSIGTLTAAIALVMPDCTGPTGATYIISNPQSAFAVTIAGNSASQPINGLTTAITIAANSSVKLVDVANARSTAGCHWTM